MPANFVHENPSVLIRLLQLGVQDYAFSQTDLLIELQINQSRLSKLMHRLKKDGWVSIHKSDGDGRKQYITTTAEGKALLSSLESALTGVGKSKAVTTSTNEPAAEALSFNSLFLEAEEPEGEQESAVSTATVTI